MNKLHKIPATFPLTLTLSPSEGGEGRGEGLVQLNRQVSHHDHYEY
jgi:hypothetical protein